MGYLDGLINPWFKKIENEKSIYYPYGKFGYGYIVDQDTEVKVKHFLKRYYAFVFSTIIIFTVLFKSFAFFLLFICIPVYLIRIKQLLSTSPKNEGRIKYKEISRNMSVSMGLPMIFIIFFMSLLLLSASIFNIFSLGHKKTTDILGVIFFGFCFLQSTVLVVYSIKNSRKHP